jgi:threonine/homoserine/homoserine lactone efflux protein
LRFASDPPGNLELYAMTSSSHKLPKPAMPTPSRQPNRWSAAAITASTISHALNFGALFPQFIDPGGDYVRQVVLMGVTAMAIAMVFDSAYAVLTGKAGALLSRRRLVPVSRASGLCLIGGGVWLALARAVIDASR